MTTHSRKLVRSMTPALLVAGLLLAAAVARTTAAPRQDVPEIKLSPSEIGEAIALGQSKSKLPSYRIGKKSMMGPLQYELATIETPPLRIARAARRAQETYQPFGPGNVTRELAGDFVMVVVPPFEISGNKAQGVEAELVLAMPKKSTDLAAAIRPLSVATQSTTLQNLFGAQWSVDTLVAYFPPAVLNPDLEFVFVFKRPVSGGDGPGKRELRGVIADKVIK